MKIAYNKKSIAVMIGALMWFTAATLLRIEEANDIYIGVLIVAILLISYSIVPESQKITGLDRIKSISYFLVGYGIWDVGRSLNIGTLAEVVKLLMENNKIFIFSCILVLLYASKFIIFIKKAE